MARRKAAKRKTAGKANSGNGANLGFEATLWAAADKLRGHMDAAVYKHVVLGLIFLKYISDAFQEKHDDLKARQKTDYTDPKDRDEYTAANIFWVPKAARWQRLQANAKQGTAHFAFPGCMSVYIPAPRRAPKLTYLNILPPLV